MTTRDCPKASLVEALRDGRLGPQEQASMERHLSTCADCAALARDLDRIGEALRAPLPPATPLEHQRARVALLERAALQSPASLRAPSRRPLVFAFAAAAMVLAVAVGWAGGRLTAPAAPAVGSQAAETTIRPSNEASFERKATAGIEVVTLDRGTLDVTVRPLAKGERFVVRTKDAEIEVRGTAFRVEAEGGRIRGVAVTEGTVEVRYAGFSAVIPSGGSWRATGDGAPAASAAPSTAPTSSASPAANTPPAASAAPSASPAASAPAATSAPTVLAASPAPPAPKIAARTVARAASPAPASIDAPIAPPAAAPDPEPAPRAAPTVPPASRDFAAAMTALGRGDYEGSAKQLEAFASAHPGDARADEADYLRAVALQRAGRAAEAAAAARRYLATRPAGAHRMEARQIAGD
ncbi:MAG: FecR domain-containing protein [Minicystis sp.]